MRATINLKIEIETLKPRLDHCPENNIINFQEWIKYQSTSRRCMNITPLPYHDAQGRVEGVIISGKNRSAF